MERKSTGQACGEFVSRFIPASKHAHLALEIDIGACIQQLEQLVQAAIQRGFQQLVFHFVDENKNA